MCSGARTFRAPTVRAARRFIAGICAKQTKAKIKVSFKIEQKTDKVKDVKILLLPRNRNS